VLAGALRQFFEVSDFNDLGTASGMLLPAWCQPLHTWLMAYLNPNAKSLNESLDVIFSATQQMAEAYCAKHPELGVDVSRQKAILRGGMTLNPLPSGITPSDDSLIANYMKSKNKCVLTK
jgi:hypothetical protein